MIQWTRKTEKEINKLVKSLDDKGLPGEDIRTWITWRYLVGIRGRKDISHIPSVDFIDTTLWAKYQKIWEKNYIDPSIAWDRKHKAKTDKAYNAITGRSLKDEDC